MAMASTTAEGTEQQQLNSTLSELEEIQRQRQAELRQQTPIWHPQHLRCGSCDDCLKGNPCLARNLQDAEQPGAFAVQQQGRARRRLSNHSSNVLERQQPATAPPQLTSTQSAFSTNSSEFMAVAVQAVIVGEEDQDVSAQERELRRQEAELEQQEAQLRQWQQELLEQQQQRQRPSEFSNSHVSTASSSCEVSSTVLVTAVPEEDMEHTQLGPGPLRFARPSTPIDAPVLQRVQELQRRWNQYTPKRPCCASRKLFTLQWHLRFLWFYAQQSSTDGSYHFPMDKIWKAEKKLQPRFVQLNVTTLGPQLYSKTLFPVPGLKTKAGHDMFYMRPSRYFPNHTPTKTIIDNLCYVMNTMLHDNPHAQQHGIGFIACMDDWSMKNFDVNYCYQFMMALQGGMVPVQTQLFLIVNPPNWFGAVWKIMKPMLAPSFRKRVKICPEFKIAKYLQDDYQQYLPNDMKTGRANTDRMVVDFVAHRHYVEQGQVVHANHHTHAARQSQLNNLQIPRHSVGAQSNNSSSGGDDTISHCSHSNSTNSHSMLESSLGRFSSRESTERTEDHDDASIHCDIDNEDALLHQQDEQEEDRKPASSAVHISNLPSL